MSGVDRVQHEQLAEGGSPTTLQTSSGPIAALTSGAGGDPVLLVPGYTGSKEDFAPLLRPLAAAGFAVTAIDLPGQYESPGPDDPARYSPDALGRVVLEVMLAMGRPAHLLGHSFGGLVGRAAVISDPTAVRSLVLLCSGPGGLGGGRRALIELLGPLLAASGMAGVYAASLALEQSQPGHRARSPELAALLERRFVSSSRTMLSAMGAALVDEPDRVGELAGTGVRTLVLYGADDDAWPRAAQDDMAERLGAVRAVVPAAAHSPAVENPEATARALIDFWRSPYGRAARLDR